MIAKSSRINTATASRIKAYRAIERDAVVAPVIAEIRAGGCVSSRRIAAALNVRGVVAPRGGIWHRSQVLRVLRRLDAA